MKTIAINIIIDGIDYISDYIDRTEGEMSILTARVELAVEGGLNFLYFECANKTYYFGKELLKKAIITLVEKK